jgi:hypothetical protein
MKENQEKMHANLMRLSQDVNFRHLPLQAMRRPVILPQKPASSKVRCSTMTKWLLTPRVMLLYYCSNKQTQNRYSLFFGAILPMSKVILIRWTCSHIFDISPSLKFQNIIPTSSKIVEACKNGDVATVQKIFMSREACPNDVTDTNHTLLMVC